jgi:hypothetical protein
MISVKVYAFEEKINYIRNNIMNTELTEQYINDVYSNIMNEHLKLLNEMKNSNTEMEKHKERDISKQLSLLTSLMTGLLKLRNLKKQVKMKADL